MFLSHETGYKQGMLFLQFLPGTFFCKNLQITSKFFLRLASNICSAIISISIMGNSDNYKAKLLFSLKLKET